MSSNEVLETVTDWHNAISKKCKVSVSKVQQVLSANGVEPQSVTPERKAIRFSSIKFSGTKAGTEDGDGTFTFDWEDLGAGLYGIFSEEVNLVGKSTIINILYGILRGSFQHINPITRAWIEKIEANFSVGNTPFNLTVDNANSEKFGRAILLKYNGERNTVLFEGSVSDLSEFMNQLFMAELNFDQIYTTLKQETLVSHGWPAMAAALLVSSSDGAIIGDQVQGYSQRLVQTFIGLPWISTQSRASAMHKILDKKIKDQMANGADSGSTSALKELQRQLEAMPDISSAEKQQKNDQTLLQKLDGEVLEMQIALNDLELNLQKSRSERETLNAEWLKMKRTLQAKQEEASAGLIFRKLQPVCCPSCESTQFKNIETTTSDDNSCPLCKDTKTTEDSTTYEADPNLVREINEAGEKLVEFDLEISNQEGDLTEKKKKIKDAEDNRGEVKARVEQSVDLSDQLTKRTALEIAINELSVAVSKNPSKIDAADSEALDILSKTFDITKKMFEEREKEVFKEASDTLKEVATKLGVKHLRNVEWTSTRINIGIADTVTTYSKLSPGEKLRFRVAASITLAQISAQTGQGRHPGILFFDSPKSEEITDSDFSEIMSAISNLTDLDADLQIFVSSVTRSDNFDPSSFSDYKLVKDNEYLF
ncbi:hypothetical protein BWR17_15205 [Phaeobacter inhibens]|uniref:coiled-coil domain-containing protein n=1 Tax=Phaeobacter inhibens TaxID=221822 RepID=UPI00097191FC|nr:hypothetical protein [Phaeobacter inhibens]APX17046.1 hypothetical protein BWR17_15205 [Phaeobacter inhibens]